jgi:hypothetical protein
MRQPGNKTNAVCVLREESDRCDNSVTDTFFKTPENIVYFLQDSAAVPWEEWTIEYSRHGAIYPLRF